MGFGSLLGCVTAVVLLIRKGTPAQEDSSEGYRLLDPRIEGEAVADSKPKAGQQIEKRGSATQFVPAIHSLTNGTQTLGHLVLRSPLSRTRDLKAG